MRNNFNQQLTYAADQNENEAASCSMCADAFYARNLTAIIALMAVVFNISVCSYLVRNIIISIILGGIILIVRGNLKPVSRTR